MNYYLVELEKNKNVERKRGRTKDGKMMQKQKRGKAILSIENKEKGRGPISKVGGPRVIL